MNVLEELCHNYDRCQSFVYLFNDSLYDWSKLATRVVGKLKLKFLRVLLSV